MISPMWFVLIISAALIIAAAPSTGRAAGPSWFDLQPYMKPSKKQSGRAQQVRKPRKKRR